MFRRFTDEITWLKLIVLFWFGLGVEVETPQQIWLCAMGRGPDSYRDAMKSPTDSMEGTPILILAGNTQLLQIGEKIKTIGLFIILFSYFCDTKF